MTTNTSAAVAPPRRIFFLSFQIYPFIGWCLAAAFSVSMVLVYGISIGETHLGTWLVLGGLSMWFPLCGFIFPVVSFLFLSIILSARNVRVSRDGDAITFRERFTLCPCRKRSNTIRQDEIASLKCKQGHVGINYLYVVALVSHMIYVWNAGFHLLTNPHVFGLGIPQGIFLVLAGVLDLVLVLLIVVRGDERMEIRTTSGDMLVQKTNIVGNRDEMLADILAMLGVDESTPEGQNSLERVERNRPRLAPAVIAGAIFLGVALTSHVFKFFAGEPLRYALYLLAAVLFIKASKTTRVFPGRQPAARIVTGDGGTLSITKEHSLARETVYLKATGEGTGEHSFETRAMPLSPLEVVLLPALALVTAMTVSSWFRFLPSLDVLVDTSIATVLLATLLMAVSIWHALFPVLHLERDTGNGSVNIDLPRHVHRASESEGRERAWLARAKAFVAANRKVVMARLLVLAVAIVAGALVPFLL